jgi:hypothetical protein
MKTDCGMERGFHEFLNSGLDGHELSASGSGCYTPGETHLYPLYKRLDGFQRLVFVVQNILMARNKYINIEILTEIRHFWKEGFSLVHT